MQKINYQRQLDKIIENLGDKVPSLLLHSCCAPCSSYCIEYLSQHFEITVLYYNPNIYPESEYEKRKAEQKRLISEMTTKHPVKMLDCDFESEKFYEMAKGLEDLLESIVGNIQDEYDQEDEEISIINDTIFEVDGITDIEEVEEHIGKTFPEGDYDTIGGYIISVLGFLPQDGEMNEVTFENVKFTVLNIEERRIGKVKVEILPIEEKEEVEERRFFGRKED